MGLRLFFLPNFPGATFIQGGTFIPDSIIPDSRVYLKRRKLRTLQLCLILLSRGRQAERDRHMTGYYSVMIAPPMLLYILSFASEREEVGKKNY